MKISLAASYGDAMNAIKHFRAAGIRAEISVGGIYVDLELSPESAAMATGILLYSGLGKDQFEIESSGLTSLQRRILDRFGG